MCIRRRRVCVFSLSSPRLSLSASVVRMSALAFGVPGVGWADPSGVECQMLSYLQLRFRYQVRDRRCFLETSCSFLLLLLLLLPPPPPRCAPPLRPDQNAQQCQSEHLQRARSDPELELRTTLGMGHCLPGRADGHRRRSLPLHPVRSDGTIPPSSSAPLPTRPNVRRFTSDDIWEGGPVCCAVDEAAAALCEPDRRKP